MPGLTPALGGTLILPTAPEGERGAEAWLQLYDEEDTWLDWALSQVGPPPAAQVLAPAGRDY